MTKFKGLGRVIGCEMRIIGYEREGLGVYDFDMGK